MELFVQELKSSIKNEKRKNNIFRFMIFSSLLVFILISYFTLNYFYSELKASKELLDTVEGSAIYNLNKSRDLTKEEIFKLFTHSFEVEEKNIIDKEQWNLYILTVPNYLKENNKIYGFLDKDKALSEVNKLVEEKIIKTAILLNPKINEGLLK